MDKEKVLMHRLKRFTNLARITREELALIRLNKQLKGGCYNDKNYYNKK